jgi:hypothetical protein
MSQSKSQSSKRAGFLIDSLDKLSFSLFRDFSLQRYTDKKFYTNGDDRDDVGPVLPFP